MKLAQESQTLSEFASIVVKTSSRCSTFTSSDVIHRASPNPGLSGSKIDRHPGEVSFLGHTEEWG
jgi:hypothetical protein